MSSCIPAMLEVWSRRQSNPIYKLTRFTVRFLDKLLLDISATPNQYSIVLDS